MADILRKYHSKLKDLGFSWSSYVTSGLKTATMTVHVSRSFVNKNSGYFSSLTFDFVLLTYSDKESNYPFKDPDINDIFSHPYLKTSGKRISPGTINCSSVTIVISLIFIHLII